MIKSKPTEIDLSLIQKRMLAKLKKRAPKHFSELNCHAKKQDPYCSGYDQEAYKVTATRDGTEIIMDLKFGNKIVRQDDVDQSSSDAFEYLDEAIDLTIKNRKELTIHAATVVAILARVVLSKEPQWDGFQRYIAPAIQSRTKTIINPRGIRWPARNDALNWTVYDGKKSVEMKLPGKRILGYDFIVSENPHITMSKDHIAIRNFKVPSSLETAAQKNKISDLISMPGLEEAGIRIKNIRQNSSDTTIHISGPTINIEEAFELVSNILKDR